MMSPEIWLLVPVLASTSISPEPALPGTSTWILVSVQLVIWVSNASMVVEPAVSAFLKRTIPLVVPKPLPLIVKTDLSPAPIVVGLMELMLAATTLAA